MKTLTLLLSFAFIIQLSAQDSTHITRNYRNGKLDEDYYLNASGEKNGKYIKYSRNNHKYVEGQFKNGFPVGTWNFYAADTTGDLVQTLNFDTHKETFCDSARVPSLVCGPRYFGGNFLKQDFVEQRIRTDFTEEERAKLKGKNIMVVFEVDSVTYKTYGADVQDNSVSPEIRAKMTKIVQEMPAWLPPVCTGGSLVWRMSVVFVFQ